MNRNKSSGALWLALPLLALWGAVIYRLGPQWNVFPDYHYGWLVPALCLILSWERRAWMPPAQPAAWPWLARAVLAGCGLGWLVAALALEIMPAWRFAAWVLGGAAWASTLGLLYLAGGKPWLRHWWFPVTLFLIAIPWPTGLEGPLIARLTQWNATLAVNLLMLLDIPAIQKANLIEIANGVVGVEEACSGIRSLQASLLGALFLGDLNRLVPWRRAVLLLAAVGFTLLTNLMRTTLLVGVANGKGMSAVDAWHDPAGFGVLGISFAGLALFAWLLGRKARPAAAVADRPASAGIGEAACANSHASEPRGRAWTWLPGLAVVVCVLAGEAGIEAWFRSGQPKNLPPPGWIVRWPATAQVTGISEVAHTILNDDESTRARWTTADGLRLQGVFLRWLPARTIYGVAKAGAAAIHPPSVCFPLSGMPLLRDFGSKELEVAGRRFVLRSHLFEDRGQLVFSYYGYWRQGGIRHPEDFAMILHGPSTRKMSSAAVRAFKAGDRPTHVEHRVLTLTIWGAPDAATAEAAFRQEMLQIIQNTP